MQIHNCAGMGCRELQTWPVIILCAFVCVCVHACVRSVVSDSSGILGTVTHQAYLAMGFSWPEH